MAAADLVGVAVREFRLQAALFQQSLHFFPGLPFGYPGVAQALPDAVPQSPTGVEGFRRGLEHHLQGSVNPAELLALPMGDVLSVQDDVPGVSVCQPGDHIHGGGFAAAAFPDDGQALPGKQAEGDAVDGGKVWLTLPGKDLGQVFYVQNRFHGYLRSLGTAASRALV